MNENTCGEIVPFFSPAAYFPPFRYNRKIKNIILPKYLSTTLCNT